MDPTAALDAAARALDCEDYNEAMDRLFDYYQWMIGQSANYAPLRNVRAGRLVVRAQDMRDRFTQAQEDKYNAALEDNIADLRNVERERTQGAWVDPRIVHGLKDWKA